GAACEAGEAREGLAGDAAACGVCAGSAVGFPAGRLLLALEHGALESGGAAPLGRVLRIVPAGLVVLVGELTATGTAGGGVSCFHHDGAGHVDPGGVGCSRGFAHAALSWVCGWCGCVGDRV